MSPQVYSGYQKRAPVYFLAAQFRIQVTGWLLTAPKQFDSIQDVLQAPDVSNAVNPNLDIFWGIQTPPVPPVR